MFSLDYHVDPPINTVFSPAAMRQYLEVFSFLWRLKRVEYTLSNAWSQWGKASREFLELTDLQQDIQYAQLTIQRMIHFIYQLQHYVLFEVKKKMMNLASQKDRNAHYYIGSRMLLGQTRNVYQNREHRFRIYYQGAC